jgi:LmbE family N-acetylglucosaminyl deacetylase
METQKEGFLYCDTDIGAISEDIQTLFPGFKEDEKVCVMSPHDDDAVIGAGYAMLAAKKAGAEIFVCIFCRGDAGYSTLEHKDTIEDTRGKETSLCYGELGVPSQNIFRMGFGDFSAIGNLGWTTAAGNEGDMPRMLKFLREHKITRVIVPNHYREHIDHTAAHWMASFNAPQSGDPILVDHGTPHVVRSVLEYSVWADFDPEDAMVHGRSSDIRANRLIIAPQWAEEQIDRGVTRYSSQAKIIRDLIAGRAERSLKNGKYIEPYIAFDPRPKIDFAPYIKYVGELLEEAR